jgi:hypothetical protein
VEQQQQQRLPTRTTPPEPPSTVQITSRVATPQRGAC